MDEWTDRWIDRSTFSRNIYSFGRLPVNILKLHCPTKSLSTVQHKSLLLVTSQNGDIEFPLRTWEFMINYNYTLVWIDVMYAWNVFHYYLPVSLFIDIWKTTSAGKCTSSIFTPYKLFRRTIVYLIPTERLKIFNNSIRPA